MAVQVNINQVIHEIIRRLTEELAPQKIILFGSYAKGQAHEDSDIDLLIIADMPEPFFKRLTRVRKAVSGTHPGIPIDPIVLTPLELEARLRKGDQFIAEVMEEGQAIYVA